MIRKLAYLTAIAAAFVNNYALTGDVLLYGQGDEPDPKVVARILGGPRTENPPVKMRSVRLLSDSADGSVPQDTGDNASRGAGISREVPPAFALPVRFTFDSATILPESAGQLDAVAAGIKMLPAISTVVIEGHTDAYGPARYNLELSRRRAVAVRAYLVLKHGIAKSSLKVDGKGASDPYDKDNAYAPENRRVQFRAG